MRESHPVGRQPRAAAPPAAIARRQPAASRQRGSIALELGLALPVLIMVLLGGIQLGRALITRHRLESAVSYATRSAAVANQTSQAVISDLIRTQLGNEANQCASLRVEARTLPSGGPGIPPALEVVADCTVVPVFEAIPTVDSLRAVAAMPLPNN